MDWGYSLFVYFNMSPGPSAGFHGPSPHGSKIQAGGYMSLLQCLSAGHYRTHNPCSFNKELFWIDESNQCFYAYNYFGDHPEKLIAWFDQHLK